ncbi:DEAD/DEAH box helicase [Mesosutterella sp. AGMB02718]|uniref:DEAD/DEAH box helicase n=1 Tax=Mesosutterella faecium TaxID=2925194 RepID=A0ABT7IP62_9BURK|nr:DEAD/DEAH box helicase [Mesosutterella sp. AGMB02718]MDL2060176.1 DEAD/DEAH box helicase [Mesosutterella sp. AGMB02718]
MNFKDLPDLVRSLLQLLALLGVPAFPTEMKAALARSGMTNKEAAKWVETLEKEGWIEPSGVKFQFSSRGYLELARALSPEELEAADTGMLYYFHSYLNPESARAVLVGMSKCLRGLPLDSRDRLRLQDYLVTMLLETRGDLLLVIFLTPGFEPMLPLIPPQAVEAFYGNVLAQAEDEIPLRDDALERLSSGLQASALGEGSRQALADELTLRQDFVQHGRPSECLARMHAGTEPYDVLQAILLLQEGRDDEALKLIKETRRRFDGSDLFDHYLSNFVLGAALYRKKDKPAVYRSLGAIANRCRRLESPLRGLALLVICEMALNRQVSEDTLTRVKSFCLDRDAHGYLAKALVRSICLHFHVLSAKEAGLNLKACRSLAEEPNSPKFIDAQLLAALGMKEEEKRLYERWGVKGLLPPFASKPQWESLLESLSVRCGMMKKKARPAEAGAVRERIVYLVDPETFTVAPLLQKSKNGASWSRGRNVALSNFKKAALPCMTAEDRSAAQLTQRYMSWEGPVYSLRGAEVLLRLAGCGRVFNASNPEERFEIQTAPLVLTVRKNEDGSYTPSANLGSGDDEADPGDIPSVIVQSRTDRGVTLTAVSGPQRDILQELLTMPSFPPEAKEKLSAFLAEVCPVLPVVSDLIGSESAAPSRQGSSVVTFRVSPSGKEDFLIRADVFPLPGVEFACRPGEGRESLFLPTREGQVQVLRDLKLESQHYEAALSELSGLGSCMEGPGSWRCGLEDCLDFLGALQRCPKGSVEVQWPAGGKLTRSRGRISFDSLRISAGRAGAWLELGGEVDVDGRSLMTISQLLEAVRAAKGRYVRLSEDSYAEVSEALKKRLRAVSLLAREKGGKVELPSVTAPFLQDLRRGGAALSADQAADALFERIDEASKLYPKIPQDLRADLRDYQAEGYRWMSRLASWGAGACLADDMGLGKTVQAIALLLSRAKEGPALIVTPASVLYNWKSELGRFAPGLRCVMLGAGNREKTVREAGAGDVLLTTYGLLASESDLFAGRAWRTAVLDEAHMIRNRGTKTAQAAQRLDAAFRLILTGTPVQNNLSEIWSLFEFINPGLLGSFEAFTGRFITPIEVRHEPGARQTLRQIISPFVLRRTKASVLEELPQKTEITLPVELSEAERALYEKIRSEALIRAEEKETSTIDLLATLMKLRQAACSPKLIDPSLPFESSKEEAFMGLVRNLIAAGHRALVFSQFTSHLALIRQALDKAGIPYLYMDGAVRASERAALAEEFQKGGTPLFLISLKAGGTGLNLTAADYVIHLDPWWNPSVEDQASDRAYRIGQTMPVTIYRLIARGTVEERILELHRTKKQLSDALLEGTDAPKSLSREDIVKLLEQSTGE